jgi:hypothetical protein
VPAESSGGCIQPVRKPRIQKHSACALRQAARPLAILHTPKPHWPSRFTAPHSEEKRSVGNDIKSRVVCRTKTVSCR